MVKFSGMIEDREIKDWIHLYQESGEGLSRIRETLADMIYQFPAIGFEVYDHDVKGDFYLYVSDRLPKILESYVPRENARFKTFFYLVLRRQYLNFIKTRKQKIRETPLNEDLPCENREEEKAKELEKISLLFASLPPKYRLILKLRCPDFLCPEDFLDLGREFGKKPSELLETVGIILEEAAGKDHGAALVAPRTIARYLE